MKVNPSLSSIQVTGGLLQSCRG